MAKNSEWYFSIAPIQSTHQQSILETAKTRLTAVGTAIFKTQGKENKECDKAGQYFKC